MCCLVDLFSSRILNAVEVRYIELYCSSLVIGVNNKTWRNLWYAYLLLARHVVVFEVTSEHSTRYETSLARKTISYGKYFSTLSDTNSIRAIQNYVMLKFCFAVLALIMHSGPSGVWNDVFLNVCTWWIAKSYSGKLKTNTWNFIHFTTSYCFSWKNYSIRDRSLDSVSR